jgi:hypothetical protein
MKDLSKLVRESLSLTTPLGSTLIVLRMGALLDGSSWYVTPSPSMSHAFRMPSWLPELSVMAAAIVTGGVYWGACTLKFWSGTITRALPERWGTPLS